MTTKVPGAITTESREQTRIALLPRLEGFPLNSLRSLEDSNKIKEDSKIYPLIYEHNRSRSTYNFIGALPNKPTMFRTL